MIKRTTPGGFGSTEIYSIGEGQYEVKAMGIWWPHGTVQPYLQVSDTTARYIEKLPEIVAILKQINRPHYDYSIIGPSVSDEIQAIITYAEGKQ